VETGNRAAPSRREYALAAACSVGLTLVLSLVVLAHDGPLGLDRLLRRLVLDHVPSWTEAASGTLTQLGSGAVLYPVLALLAFKHRTYYAAAMPAVLAAGQVLEAVALSALPRAAPDLVAWPGLSSGRTASAVLGWGLVALVLGASARRSMLVGGAVGAVVALSRVLLDVHWASDVLLALLFGTALLSAVIAVESRVPHSPLPLMRAIRWSCGSSVGGHVIPQGWRHAMPHGVRV
jgi:membrane-associated phospholipid phosphatase